jgi:hypothetical protein
MSHYLDPVNQAFADFGAKSGLSPVYKMGIGGRDVFEKVQTHEPASDVVSTSFDVPTKASPSGSVKTWIRKPKDAKRDLPVVFLFLYAWRRVDLGEVCDCNGDEDVALVIYGPNTFGSRDWLCVCLPILCCLPLTQSTPRNWRSLTQ